MELSAHDLALKYLSRRDRTSYEVKKHLASKGIPEEEIRECLEYLAECGLIDDGDYCERYILYYGMGKGRGPLRLEKELSDKGISSEIVRPALEAHFGSGGEQRVALAYVEKLLRQGSYAGSGGPIDAEDLEVAQHLKEPQLLKEAESLEEAANPVLCEKELARIGRRLASQGYHSHVIYEVLGKLRR